MIHLLQGIGEGEGDGIWEEREGRGGEEREGREGRGEEERGGVRREGWGRDVYCSKNC